MKLTTVALEAWTRDLLIAAGLTTTDAQTAAEIYRRASLRGLGHHDLSALPQRLRWLTSPGGAKARPQLELVSHSPATEVWDGDCGLGEVLVSHITRRAMDIASRQGLGYASVRRSNHFLAGDPYVQIGAEAGFLIVVWSNTDAGMGFPGGGPKVMGNNPLAWGLGQDSFGLSADLCMAETSIGNLGALAATDARVPIHWGRGPDGFPAETARRLQQGVIEPIGGAKGLSLALLGEVLTGVLSGGATFNDIPGPEGLNCHNQMVLAFDLQAFGGSEIVGRRVEDLRARIVGAGLSRLPGDRSREAQKQSLREGLNIPPGVSDSLKEWSIRFGVRVPSEH